MRFTVRRPPIGEVSPCGHRPSGGDVASSIHGGVTRSGRAGFALENRLALAVPRSDVPAHRASLRRIRGRDLLDPTERLVLQTRGEKPPTTPADSPVQPALLSNTDTGRLNSPPRRASHRPHVEFLNPDCVEAASYISTGLFDPVFSPVGLTGCQFRDRPFRSRTLVGALLCPGKPLLQHRQPPGLTSGQAGCLQQFAGRQGRRHGNAAVDTHHAAVARPRDRVGDVGERDMPAAGPITGNPVGPDPLWNRPRQAKPHPTDLGHPQSTEAAVQLHHVMRFQRDLPKPFMHTGLTPRRASVGAIKEHLHGLREIPQRLLLHGLTAGAEPRVLAAGLGQLRGLLNEARSPTVRLPMPLLLHRQVPHIARIPAVHQRRVLLLSDGQKPEPRHTRPVTTNTDIPGVARQFHAPSKEAK